MRKLLHEWWTESNENDGDDVEQGQLGLESHGLLQIISDYYADGVCIMPYEYILHL